MRLPTEFVDMIVGHRNVDCDRSESFILALDHLWCQKVRCIVETGSIRCEREDWSDGRSTYIFAKAATALSIPFYTVDIDPKKEDFVEAACRGLDFTFVCDDSVKFLSKFDGSISLLYLDSWDYNERDKTVSQCHQLAEYGAASAKLTNDALILLDDCGLPSGGKGGLVEEYLPHCGWSLGFKGYQHIYVRQ